MSLSSPISMKTTPFDDDETAMPPPPPKRVRTSDDADESTKATGLDSIMKRGRYNTSPPTTEEQVPPKRINEDDAPTKSAKDEKKLDPTVFASAYALASLALSPQQQRKQAPHSPKSPQTREEDIDRMDSEAALRDPSSPYATSDPPVPVSPDTSMLARRRRRVQFANRITSTRTIPGRAPSRIMKRLGTPAFRTPPRHPYWLQEHPHHHHSRLLSPWQTAMPPPSMYHHRSHHLLSAPPPPEKEWLCDFCHVASFRTYHEACAHEAACKSRRTVAYERDDDHSIASLEEVKPKKEAREAIVDESVDPSKWSTGCIPLSIPSADKEWLSELNCFVRTYCVEAYSAAADEISRASKRGRIMLHQVGIRCVFCKERSPKEKAVAAVSFPTSVSGIYESVKRWQRVHQSACKDVPEEFRERLEELQNTAVWVPTTRQYWTDSARALGMVDTNNGIRFERPPSAPEDWSPDSAESSSDDASESSKDGGYVVFPCDEEDIPPYVYFLMRQVEQCKFTEADRFVARSKGPVGFAGFQCRHCSGHAGLGKYFPLTAKSLSTNSTSQNIHAHLLKCRKCPNHLKQKLLELKSEKGKSPRLVPGWRRAFFDKIWERLHGEEATHN